MYVIKQNAWMLTSKASYLQNTDKSFKCCYFIHFRVNLTIPFLDEVIGNLQNRFAEGQETVLKGILLIPPHVVTCEDWEQSIDPFIQC